MTGACPYSDRCESFFSDQIYIRQLTQHTFLKMLLGVFMHDFRIKAEGARVRTTRQTKADNTIKDTFYWPDMTVSFLFRKIRPVYVL